MTNRGDGYITQEIQADQERARQTAQVAHRVLIKLREMGLPEGMDADLASLCTDLGDLWSAQQALNEQMEALLNSPHQWSAVGDSLVDLKASIEHMAWHLKSVRRPIARIARHAYRQAAKDGVSEGG